MNITQHTFILAAIFAATVASADVRFATDGAAAGQIYTSVSNKPAGELAAYLGKITGGSFSVVTNKGDAKNALVKIEIGQVKGLPKDDRGKQGYGLVAKNGKLTITAPTTKGLLDGVYGFLYDHCGVKFLTKDVEVVPSDKNLKLADFKDVQYPTFALRGYIYNPWWNKAFLEKQRGFGLVAHYNITAAHSFYSYISPGEYFKDHPEWFPMDKEGKRFQDGNMPLCGTNEELAKELAKKLLAAYDKKNPDDVYEKSFIECAQGDGFTPCHCPECRKLVQEEGTDAAPYILMLNRALDIANKTRPQLKVCTFAYYDTLYPPKKLRIHKNLYFTIVSSSFSSYSSCDNINTINESPINCDFKGALEAWAKRLDDGSRLAVYDWDGPFTANSKFTEWPNMYAQAEDIKYFAKIGAFYNMNIENGGLTGWWDINHYVWMSLFWDASKEPRALAREFIENYFGKKAAPFVCEYFDYIDQVRKDSWYPGCTSRWFGWGIFLTEKYWTPPVRAKMQDLLRKGIAAARTDSDPEYAKRLYKCYCACHPQIHLTASETEPFKFVEKDGKKYFVRGGKPEVVEALDDMMNVVSGGEWEKEIYVARYRTSFGSEVATLASPVLEAVFNKSGSKGGMVSLVHKKTGKQIVADGAEGFFDRCNGGACAYKTTNAEPASVQFDAGIAPGIWLGNYGNLHFGRDVSLAGSKLSVIRRFVNTRRGCMLRKTADFASVFSLALPDAASGVVSIEIGKDKKLVPLAKFSESGNAEAFTVKRMAELSASDAQDLSASVMEAVSITDKMTFAVPANADKVAIRFGRGDGLAVVIESADKGWANIVVEPKAVAGRLDITFNGVKYPGIDSVAPTNIPLPGISLSVAEVPVVFDKKVAEKTVALPKAAVKIRKTGENTAINDLDGAEMIWIPAGEFIRGNDKAEFLATDMKPARKIKLGGYWMYKYPVTREMYKKVLEASGKTLSGEDANIPAGCLKDPMLPSWNEAAEYARLVGGDIPTDAQWAKAARGDKDARLYPWGDTWEPNRVFTMERVSTHEFGQYQSLPVGSFPESVSLYGIHDMIGGHFEWVRDWYGWDYYTVSPDTDPAGPEKGRFKVLKGGDSNYGRDVAQIGYRFMCSPDVRGWCKTGFRCVITE